MEACFKNDKVVKGYFKGYTRTLIYKNGENVTPWYIDNFFNKYVYNIYII